MSNFISIVIPCYNDYLYIEQAVKSAINQNYENKEIIIVADGSDERTISVLKKLEPQVDRIIYQMNQGLSAARNNGIIMAKGNYILVWDADDYFEPSFCRKAYEIITTARDCKLITCQARRFNEFGTIDIFTPSGGTLKDFLFSNSAIGNSLFKKSHWKEAGGYNVEMKNGYEDWEFFIRLLQDSGKAYVLQEPLFNYRQKKISMRLSANKIKYEIWEYIYIKHEELYKMHYPLLISNFIEVLKSQDKSAEKILSSKNYQLGKFLLQPLRWIKRNMNL
ncbi:MAG: glycosyl transferase family 2 [Cytophagaceae bacterium]|nr:glycosyl transferase family 2 [Cytophagaceae bacterium]